MKPELLRRVDALQRLDDQALEEFRELAVGTRRDKGDEIVGHIDPSRDVYFVLDGLVRVELCHANGQYITFQLLPAGEMFGELSAIDGLGRSASASVEEDAMLACMSQRLFILHRRTSGLCKQSGTALGRSGAPPHIKVYLASRN